jgi:glycosyltransferase involved in cell wall biosynthesis
MQDVGARSNGSPGGGRRVWIVNHYAAAPDMPAGTRHFELGRSLAARGDRVTIFAAGRSHLTGSDERLAGARLYRSQWYDGVHFVWLRTSPYLGNTWRRQVNMLSFVAVFLVVQTRWARPDVVIGSTVHPFAAFAAWLASRLRGARFIFEIRDLWPQTLVDLGAMRPGSSGERLLRTLEAFLVRRASVVITLLPGMRDYLAERGLPRDHVVYVPNGVNLAAADAKLPLEGSPEVRAALAELQRLREQGRFVLAYVGTFGRVNRVDVVIRAAAIAEKQAPGRVGVLLVGDGPERAALLPLVADTAPVVFGPSVPKTFVHTILRAVDATIVHVTRNPVYRYGISFNKLFEYMAAEHPVVFACASDYDPVAISGAGVTVPPDDPEGLAGAFLALADATPDARTRMGLAGRRYVEREHDLARLGALLAAVVDGRRPGNGAPAADLSGSPSSPS